VSKARNREFAFAMLGWGSYSGDLALRSLVATFDATKGYGTWNWGRYSDPRVDALVERSLATVDPAAREPIAQDAMRAAMQSLAVIPLHHQVATWAMRKDLEYAARTDEYTLAQYARPR
jgi:peptide/nickel transport system substrate-binding protein